MTPDDRALMMSLALQVGELNGHVADLRESLREDLGGIRQEVAGLSGTVRALQLTDAAREGAAATTRTIAQQAGAGAAKRERRKERWAQSVATFVSLVIAAYAAAIKP